MTAIGLKSRKKSINSVSLGILEALKLKLQTLNFPQINLIQFQTCLTYHFQNFSAKYMKNVKKGQLGGWVRFQLYQSHSLTSIWLRSGKKTINWVSLGILDTLHNHTT